MANFQIRIIGDHYSEGDYHEAAGFSHEDAAAEFVEKYDQDDYGITEEMQVRVRENENDPWQIYNVTGELCVHYSAFPVKEQPND